MYGIRSDDSVIREPFITVISTFFGDLVNSEFHLHVYC